MIHIVLMYSSLMMNVKATLLNDENTNVFFGLGCYWGSQHLMVEQFERGFLNRLDADITSVAGYAGSEQTGPDGQVCYFNYENISYYVTLGHAEVTNVVVPTNSLQAAFSVYFSAFTEYDTNLFGRPDYFDQGPNYRAVLGFPGGIDNEKVMGLVHSANVNNMTLVKGIGGDDDTFLTNKVYIMDSTTFPFVQAEVCMQFYDASSQGFIFNASYYALRPVLEANGRLVRTTCPHVYLCNSDTIVA